MAHRTRAQKESEPYIVLALRVIEQACDDKDTKYLRGEIDDLKFWLYVCDIDSDRFHQKMWQRFPRKARVRNMVGDRA